VSKDALEEQFDNEKPVQVRIRRLADWINPTGPKKNHSLIDKVYQKEHLSRAWERVKENRGSRGVDKQSVAGFEAQCDQQLDRLQEELRDDCYQPQPVRQAPIPKAGKPGEFRTLGMAAKRSLLRSDTNGVRPRMSTGAAATAGTDLRAGIRRSQLRISARAVDEGCPYQSVEGD
jgi:hypothetical protein